MVKHQLRKVLAIEITFHIKNRYLQSQARQACAIEGIGWVLGNCIQYPGKSEDEVHDIRLRKIVSELLEYLYKCNISMDREFVLDRKATKLYEKNKINSLDVVKLIFRVDLHSKN